MKHPSSIQRSSQKTEDLPSPSTASVVAWKADSTTLFPTDGNVTHGRLDWSLRCHSHLRCRATLKRRRSSRPSPPSSLGRHTTGHATLHCSPMTWSLPDQRKARRRLSICPTAQGDKQTAMDMCVGMAERVTAVRVALPAKLSRLPFQARILLATALIRVCSSDRFSL